MVKRCLVVLVIAGRVAAAQPGATAPARPLPPPPELVSEDKELCLTVGGTLGAFTLFVVVVAADDSL